MDDWDEGVSIGAIIASADILVAKLDLPDFLTLRYLLLSPIKQTVDFDNVGLILGPVSLHI